MSAKDTLRVLVLSRSYPSDLFPNLGLWVERPTALLNERDGVEVRVVSPQPYCPPLPELGPLRQYARFRRIPRREEWNGIDVLRPRFATGPARSTYRLESRSYDLGIRRTVDRVRRDFPFDLVHAHFIYPEGAAAHRLSRRYGVPFVSSEHAPWTPAWFASATVRRESVDAARAAGGIMPDSRSVEASIRKWIGDEAPISIVPEGVDGAMFTPAAAADRISDQILFVGWLNYRKGVDVLLRAMELIARRGEPGRLVLVGGSYYRDTRLQEQEIRQLAESLRLGDRVSFLGPRPHEEVARLMAESAVLVLPSQAEPFGAVLVEALAAGTPIVATRSGGPEDIITPDVGLLVPVGDPAALADALTKVLRERARYSPELLRRYALEHFGWPRIVDGWLDMYARALDRPVTAPERAAARGSVG